MAAVIAQKGWVLFIGPRRPDIPVDVVIAGNGFTLGRLSKP
jgi:hypothetical protein